MVFTITYGDDWKRKNINGRTWFVKYTEDLIICKQMSENGLGFDRTAYAPAGMSEKELKDYLK